MSDSTGNSDASKNLRPWPKGVSGNPSGRPKGFAASIRKKTREGEELITLALKVLRGKLSVMEETKDGSFKVEPSIKERLEAMKWLADRGWGKALDLSAAPDDGKSKDIAADIAARLAALQ